MTGVDLASGFAVGFLTALLVWVVAPILFMRRWPSTSDRRRR